MKRIILASASPRRSELLKQIGVTFEVMVSDGDEVFQSDAPQEIVKELAFQKAENVAKMLEEKQSVLADTIIIGADTVVVRDGEILGKPADDEDAFRMIRSLAGRGHEVFTGTAILVFDREGNREDICHAEETKVFVEEMSDEEIDAYISTGESTDKAGAYGIQGRFAAHIRRIEGDYCNVVGLPAAYVYCMLRGYSS